MNDLILFYYLSWLLYIVSYFFMPLTPTRTTILMIILSFISLSLFYVTFDPFIISSSFMLLIIGTFIAFGFTAVRLYELLSMFICMLCYTGLLIWEKVTPVFFFMSANVMIASFIVLLIYLLINSFKIKIIIIITGLTFGQLIYESLLYLYGNTVTIGSYHYINYLLMTIILLIVVENVKRLIIFTMTYPIYKYD